MTGHPRPLAWIVDDSPALLRLMQRQLTLLGASVRLFDAAGPCLGALAAHPSPNDHPDLLLIDRNLADADGVGLGALARLSGYRRPMALFTATDDAATRAAACASGFDTTLPKPLNAGALAWLTAALAAAHRPAAA